MRVHMIAAFVTLLAPPVAAQGFTAENGLRVTPAPGGFSVEGEAGGGARAIWCAAGDYAVRKAGARGADRLYLAMPRKAGLGQRAAVGFSLDAGGLTPSAVLVTGLSLGNAGANVSVGHARSFCSNKSPSPGGTR